MNYTEEEGFFIPLCEKSGVVRENSDKNRDFPD